MASKSKSRRNTASRGFVNNTILECLLDGDKYGYEIIKQVKDKSDGKVVLKEPSLYSSLKRFELKGYITSYWGDSDIGGRRHYYSLTEPGRKYYMSIKSPTPIDLDDIEDDTTDTTEQISIENLNNEIYNLENEVEEVDDSKYINNMSFNVADRMNELLNDNNDNVEEMVDSPTLTESKENVDNIFDTVSEITNDEKELIEEINSAVSVTEEVVENTCNTTEQDTNTEYQDYMYEHKFRANNSKELSSGTEKYVQYDLFSDNSTVNSYVDAPTIAPSEVTSITEKENISANNTETEITKDIPLIKETEVDFFNWNELKRKATTNKSSFSNSNISRPAKKYDINYSEPQEQTPVQNNIKNNVQPNDYKTTSDLHNLFESNKPNNESKVIDNISPTRVNNKIFDNVK